MLLAPPPLTSLEDPVAICWKFPANETLLRMLAALLKATVVGSKESCSWL